MSLPISSADAVTQAESLAAFDETTRIDPSLMSENQELSAFSRLRRKLLIAVIRHKFHTARLRLVLVVSLSIFFWIGLYFLFSEGFIYINKFEELKPSVFNIYYSALMVMLTVSSGLLIYSGVYRSDEVRYLLSMPVRCEAIFIHKFQEAVWFGGWGFLLTSTPMLVASGVTSGAPWYYYAMMLPFLISFVYIPTGLGAMLCVIIVAWMPRRRFHLMSVGVVVLLFALGYIVYSALSVKDFTFMTGAWWQKFSERLSYTEQRFLPSYWLSAGLLEAEQRASLNESWQESVMYLALLVSNALMIYLIATRWIGKLLRSSYQKLQAESSSRSPTAIAFNSNSSPWWQSKWQFFLPTGLRILMHKEWRVFRRDPVQWLQFVVFLGLLVLYIVNLKRFQTGDEHATMIGFLNLAVVGLILSTFTTRFIFPMISLEGRRFWILNLLPIERSTILYSKFLFAAFGSWFPCALLIYMSDSMLELPDWVMAIHQLSCVELCLGLAGMAVGLGALLVDLREQTPAKIAAGFGGTLNLVGSALFILISVLVSAVPAQMKIIQDKGIFQFPMPDWLRWCGTREAILYSQLFNISLTVAISWGAMRFGVRAFRKQDF